MSYQLMKRTLMVNNSTNNNKINKQLSPQIIEHKNHKIVMVNNSHNINEINKPLKSLKTQK